jgi:hypothetical protein
MRIYIKLFASPEIMSIKKSCNQPYAEAALTHKAISLVPLDLNVSGCIADGKCSMTVVHFI